MTASPVRWVLLLCLFRAPGVFALDELSLGLGDLTGEGWQLQDVSVRFELDADGAPAGLVRIGRLESSALAEPLEQIELRCPALEWAAEIRCPDGQLRAAHSPLGALQGQLAFQYRQATGEGRLQLRLADFSDGEFQVDLRTAARGWTAVARLAGVSIAGLQSVAAAFGQPPLPLTLAGTADATLEFTGGPRGAPAVAGTLQVHDGGFSDEEGLQAGEGLALELRWDGVSAADGWQLEAELVARAGQAYLDPMYWDFSEISKRGAPLRVQGRVHWQPAAQRLHIRHLAWRHADALGADVTAQLRTAPEITVESLQVTLHDGQLPGLFSHYLQPWLAETSMGELVMEGRCTATLEWDGKGLPSLALALEDVQVSDALGRFAFSGLQGDLQWADDGASHESRLGWASGQLFRIPIGATELRLAAIGQRLELARAIRLPVLDGLLLVDEFTLARGETLEWSLDATLTPVSMPALTGALGWPEMAGTLSGMVPAVQYRNGDLEVGGTLLVRAFDGELTLNRLRLERPFGLVPRLWTDIKLSQWDLEALTGTFAFGKIEGRLSGAVNGLYMESWRPVAFDAWFETPKGDESRRRISQKAVDNLSSIGGGVSGVLSKSFLRFLEDFPYRDLGIRCHLQNGICDMSGVAPAPQGYYIVRGTVLPPRIDVIGYRDQVDWNSLIQRLQAVTSGDGPTVE